MVRGANWEQMGSLNIFENDLVGDDEGVRLMRAKYD